MITGGTDPMMMLPAPASMPHYTEPPRAAAVAAAAAASSRGQHAAMPQQPAGGQPPLQNYCAYPHAELWNAFQLRRAATVRHRLFNTPITVRLDSLVKVEVLRHFV